MARQRATVIRGDGLAQRWASASPAAKPAFSSAPKLTDRVAEAIQNHIAENGIVPGTQLPTIVALSGTYGVSPTVVREALARLRSEGLVEVRQGSGAYVSASLRPFRIAAAAASDTTVLRVLELRLGVEAEAAALAAARASRGEVRQIQEALQAFAPVWFTEAAIARRGRPSPGPREADSRGIRNWPSPRP